MNSYVLDSLRGLRETMQFGDGHNRLSGMCKMIDNLSTNEWKMRIQEGAMKGIADSAVVIYSFIAVAVGAYLMSKGETDFPSLLISVVTLMSSFGPVAAIASLSVNLNHTFASGERVLKILNEKPVVEPVTVGNDASLPTVRCSKLGFRYEDERVLEDVNINIENHALAGISGKSGAGKSTLLRLLMRFWKSTTGSIQISGHEINSIKTSSLRDIESFVTQETVLFADTIEQNIRIAKLDATEEEIIEAAKKAAIHDFILTLPDGYQSKTGELGDRLSGGERQRIGLARAFLHGGKLLLLDEPTSNLDSLNEAIILNSIVAERATRTVILVSHRASTMKIADHVYSVENGRVC
jgi:ATP-binding cassette subfamily C protein